MGGASALKDSQRTARGVARALPAPIPILQWLVRCKCVNFLVEGRGPDAAEGSIGSRPRRSVAILA